ncbi:T9SS type A sorting domain-containing protein [Psychroserpens sp. Hel_I_66]|uniref:T9SS type A sorting domain-containing protein n=1 Tax=Psychroserpens sp. Hel_I_66 TaxID=1250004 RepID=UPI0006472C99|nr:T9SS type A sorting domain-containing protein [Psychroserpens sp. Hel_I_66]
MKNYLLLAMLFALSILNAQTGDTLSEAILCDGINAEIDVLAFDSASNSMQEPTCVSSEDIFYKHTVSSGENKVTIGMASLGVIVAVQMNYQILLAPGGDTSNLQDVSCDSYNIPILAGGSFEQIISDVNPGDVYYLRAYVPSGLGSLLTGLLSSTLVTMVSEFDSTLSTPSIEEESLSYVVNKESIKLLNNQEPLRYQIYSLEGKTVLKSTDFNKIDLIDISSLEKGIYIFAMQNNAIRETSKFIKY